MFRSLSLVLAVTAFVGSCKSEDPVETATCAQTACVAGKKRCQGRAVVACQSDGLAATSVTLCGDDQVCQDDPDGGASTCKSVGCFPGDPPTCKAGTTIIECIAQTEPLTVDGQPVPVGEWTERACKVDIEACKAGACRSRSCTPKEYVLGFRVWAVCEDDGGKWRETPCQANEISVLKEGVPACVTQPCAPHAARCSDDKTALVVCKADATGEESIACGAGEACDGQMLKCVLPLCQAAADGSDAADGEDSADGTDQSDATDGVSDIVESDVDEPTDNGPPIDPGLKPKEFATAKIDGETLDFPSGLTAKYQPNAQGGAVLQIVMNKGVQKVELRFQPIEELTSGAFTDADKTTSAVTINYHDGSPLIGDAQFRYTSVTYDIDLTLFGPEGGRIQGRFTGTLTDDGGASTIPLEAGEFDIERD